MIEKKAFSLIELSIVLAIIGIIIASVLAGGKLVLNSRIVAAQSLTQSSAVREIDGLVLWLETTTEESFLEKHVEDGKDVAIWYDISLQSTISNNVSQISGGKYPKYYNESIKDLPSVYFDGSDDALIFDKDILGGRDYTIVSIEKSDNINNSKPYINWEFKGDINNVVNIHDTPLTSVGKTSSGHYNGYIGEIIIYSRILSDLEIEEINGYLLKKWRIKI